MKPLSQGHEGQQAAGAAGVQPSALRLALLGAAFGVAVGAGAALWWAKRPAPTAADALPPMTTRLEPPLSVAPPASAQALQAGQAGKEGQTGQVGQTGQTGQGGAKPAAAPSGPPVAVSTVRARVLDVPLEWEGSATLSPWSSVEIKPQLAGVVAQVHAKEGQTVPSGALLFTLDDREAQARLSQAKAQLARSQAQLQEAERQWRRGRELLAQQFVSQGTVEAAQSQAEAARAVAQADEAAVQAAQLVLSHTRILAPGAGRIGLVPVFAGSSVSPQGAALATLTQTDPLAVSFALPQQHLFLAQQALARGEARVRVKASDGSGPERLATLEVLDSVVDASGAVKAKARLSNPGGAGTAALWPGSLARVSLTLQTLHGATLIPHAAVVHSPRGRMVYTVSEDALAVVTPVSVLAVQGEEAVVSGLKPGARVVLDGRQNLRPLSKVQDSSSADSGKARP
jgi:RND family efflux transporter MFP subunit